MAGYEAVGACLKAPNRNPAVVDFVVDTSERHGFGPQWQFRVPLRS